jgi:nucleoid DNA-binding protein
MKMNELIQQVAQKAGLPEDKAKTAVDTVLNFLKNKLPANMSSQIDNVVSGDLAGMEEATQSVGGLFGKK